MKSLIVLFVLVLIVVQGQDNYRAPQFHTGRHQVKVEKEQQPIKKKDAKQIMDLAHQDPIMLKLLADVRKNADVDFPGKNDQLKKKTTQTPQGITFSSIKALNEQFKKNLGLSKNASSFLQKSTVKKISLKSQKNHMKSSKISLKKSSKVNSKKVAQKSSQNQTETVSVPPTAKQLEVSQDFQRALKAELLESKEGNFDTRFNVEKKENEEAELGQYNLFGSFLNKIVSKANVLQEIADLKNKDAMADMDTLLYLQQKDDEKKIMQNLERQKKIDELKKKVKEVSAKKESKLSKK